MCRIKNYSSTTTILHHFQAFQTPSPILHLSYIWPRYWTACSVLHGCLTACSVYLTACSMLHGYLAACSMDVCVSVHLHAACWMLHFIFSLLFSFPFFFLLFLFSLLLLLYLRAQGVSCAVALQPAQPCLSPPAYIHTYIVTV